MVGFEGGPSYSPYAKTLHWLAALCVLSAWTIGSIGDDLPKTAEAAALTVHMGLGLIVVAITALRLAARMTRHPSLDMGRFSPWLNYLATFIHWLLYVLLAAVPAVGIALQFARGKALSVFWILNVASPWPADRAFAHSLKEVHEVLANTLMIVAALHIAAALFHHFILRDGTLRRMLPQP